MSLLTDNRGKYSRESGPKQLCHIRQFNPGQCSNCVISTSQGHISLALFSSIFPCQGEKSTRTLYHSCSESHPSKKKINRDHGRKLFKSVII